MAETEKPGESVRAVDRALEILLAFTATDYELTVGQLLKRVDLSRPTLYRLLYTLEQCGFVVSEEIRRNSAWALQWANWPMSGHPAWT